MKQSQLFTKTTKEAPKDETAVNAVFLERAGFIQKVMAGVHTLLPLGFRVLSKIEQIIRDEMSAIGGQEVLMPSLQPKANWDATGRWDGLDILFKIDSRHGSKYALGPTHEEIITPTAGTFVSSYKDLPFAVYQIQTKFRDEPRAKSGLLRGREFRMKDLYSFHATEKDLENYYDKVAIPAYQKVFKRMSLNVIVTEASGGTFSKYSHEFQVEIKNGEDEIYVCENCGLAKNREIYKGIRVPGLKDVEDECTNCGKNKFRKTFASEVGNIFKLKSKFSDNFKLYYKDENGTDRPVIMGCYGIGTTRLMGTIVEIFHDDKGMIWPESLAPFQVHLLDLTRIHNSPSPPLTLRGGRRALLSAEQVYQTLLKAGVEVLYDDREVSAGVKFADSDLIGIPYRIVVSEKTEKAGKVELKKRSEEKAELITFTNLVSRVKK